MEMFQYNQTNVLVTTPLATRGLDFSEVPRLAARRRPEWRDHPAAVPARATRRCRSRAT